MTNNPNNAKYQSVLGETQQTTDSGPVFRSESERKLKSQEFYLVPGFRKEPDIERLGRAILELATLELAKEKTQAEK